MGAKQGTAATHGAPLGQDEVANVKAKFGIDPEPFAVQQAVVDHFRAAGEKGDEACVQGNALLQAYKVKYPTEYDEIIRRIKGELPTNWKENLPKYTPDDKTKA